MCLKIAENGTDEPASRRVGKTENRRRGALLRFAGWPVGRFAHSWGAPSITRRLTLHYVASTAALLLLASGYLYWTLERNLDHTRHALLASKIEVLRHLLREPDKAQALASEVEHEASESHPLRYYLRILDEEDQVLLETPGMDDLVPPGLFVVPAGATAEALRSVREEARHGRSLLVLSVPAAAGRAGTEKRTLQIALDTTTGDILLADYRHKLVTVLVLGVVFAAVAGVWVARKGMQPLIEITQVACHITASQLHERIAGARWPEELRELAEAFDAMLNRLEDSFARLSQFSGDLAHELRTPINNLRGEAEVALARARQPDDYRQILESSLEEYDRLSRMIDGLLFLARTDNPKAALERTRFDARKEIEAVREFYDAWAREQDVEVACEGKGWLSGDPVLFRRAVSNLLANALQHTPAKGRVHIHLGLTGQHSLEVAVQDTGAGIAPEHQPRIFDRFFRVGRPRAEGRSGTGLGLAIVQSIMRLHGGTASVRSRLGEGTTFTLDFPA